MLLVLKALSLIFNVLYVSSKNQFTAITGVDANSLVNVLFAMEERVLLRMVALLFCNNL